MNFGTKIQILLLLLFYQNWSSAVVCNLEKNGTGTVHFYMSSFLKRKNTSKTLLYTSLTILFPPQKWVKFCRNNDHSFAKRKWEENHEKKHLPKGRFCFSGDIFSALLYQYTDKNKNRTGCQNSCGQDMQYWHFLIKHGHLSTTIGIRKRMV